jgi:hypothetical protein
MRGESTVDWLVAGLIGAGSIWLASQLLDGSGAADDRCPHCGADIEISEQGIELLRLGLVGSLPASCVGCGAPGSTTVAATEEDPWVR